MLKLVVRYLYLSPLSFEVCQQFAFPTIEDHKKYNIYCTYAFGGMLEIQHSQTQKSVPGWSPVIWKIVNQLKENIRKLTFRHARIGDNLGVSEQRPIAQKQIVTVHKQYSLRLDYEFTYLESQKCKQGWETSHIVRVERNRGSEQAPMRCQSDLVKVQAQSY